MWRLVAGLAVLAALARGCGPVHGATASSGIPVGRSVQTIEVGGLKRTFHLYRPADLSAGATPLVVFLHGGFGSGTQAEGYYGWDGEASGRHFLVVYPDGVDHAWAVGGGCCGKPAATGVNDVAFISAMVARIGAQISLDPARLYATGISNGGLMAYRLACDTHLFAAIGPDSATLLGPCPDPASTSVIHIHGTADMHIPYLGGRGQGVAHIDGPAVPMLNATWRGIDRCSPPTVTTHAPVTTSLATCPAGRAVELITIAGAGHQWPGSPDRPLIQKLIGTDPPSQALDATPTIWAFFATRPMR